MKKMTNLLFFLLIAVNIFSIETTASSIIFKDITKEHWAYKSIENLSQKGILNINGDIFNGEKGINRFDMAFYLSKTLDRVEQDKADREDLIVLEHIVYEFSEELSKFGFDSKTYLERINSFEDRIEANKKSNDENKENLSKVEERVKLIEDTIYRKNKFVSSEAGLSEKFNFLNDVNVYLKSNMDYQDSGTEDSDFKGAHQLGLAFKRSNYELFLEGKTSDKERKNDSLLIKGQMDTEIGKGFTLNFHTTDYERYLKSRFNNVIYDNHNSYQYTISSTGKTYEYDSFDSYGVAIVNNNFGIYVEKTRTDYDGVFKENNAKAITIDDSFSDSFNFISQMNYKYLEALVLKNGDTENLDYEVVLKYPIKKFQAALGYAEKIGTGRYISGVNESDTESSYVKFDKLSVVNGELVYGGKSNLTVGFESKFNEGEKLYTTYYGSYKYNLTDSGKIKYKYEYINRDKALGLSDYQNHYIMVNIYGSKLNTYGAYNIIGLNKNYYVNEGKIYSLEKDYKETLIKSTYKINDKSLIKLGYLLREMNATTEKEEIKFIQGQYNVNSSTSVFLKYIKNTGDDFNDRRLDADSNIIDVDFDSRTGVIRAANEGRVELGIELVF